MNRIDSRNSLQWLVGSLLLLSGLCALVYQVGWLRELRLVFGGSTLATAVVLAIFMGGLGFGGLFWGRVADRHANPLRLYAFFEIGIALLAAISPFLLILVRNIYLGLGGSLSLGVPLAIMVRLAAAALVLGGPTFLMGGTLPAVARALETDADHGRRRLALLYGLNTLGGVIGVILATFFLLEFMGTRLTVWSGSLLNLLVGLLALALASQYKKNQVREAPRPVEAKPLPAGAIHEDLGHFAGTLPSYYVYITAFLVGFAFFVMEIVWNRMLTPLLGGSVYSFGLIIAVVLSGIGLGGWLYSLGDKRLSATTGALALTVGLEALALAVPFALGDRFAVLAAILRPFGDLGFGGLLLGWTVVTAFVVFPASLVAGFQFPLLVNLLGRGRRDVGSHTGKVYAWNTFGAITGLLAGGMGLMRLLSAPGCWQATVVLLSLLGGSAAIVALFQQGRRALPVSALLGVGVALFLITAAGPTAAWRHTPIGAGNVSLAGKNRIGIRDWLNQSRRIISQDIEGIESSIGFQVYDGLGFVINGKVDGNAARDADTQIMGPFIGAILHPEPRKALVIGLGTGASGGWLADIASVEQVDIMELEPAMLEVARLSSQANRNVLENSKVRMIIGDARESLMTSRQQYDIIFSEPSNPYRAGIASLYTREFYHAVHERLQPDGYFSQWVQAYDVDSQTLYVIIATLATVFQEVEVWQSSPSDLIFVCSKKKHALAVPRLRERVASEPFRSAMMAGWVMNGLEGFFAARLAGPDFAQSMVQQFVQRELINSDDRMLVEFGLARSTGRVEPPSVTGFRQSLKNDNDGRPPWGRGINDIDWDRVNKSYAVMFPDLVSEMIDHGDQSPALQYWRAVYAAFLNRDYRTVFNIWKSVKWLPEYPLELSIIGEAAAQLGDDGALEWAQRLEEYRPVEANFIRACYFWRKGEAERAYRAMEAALSAYRENPWPQKYVMQHALDLAAEMALGNSEFSAGIYDLLRVPFSVYNLDELRLFTLLRISSVMDCERAVDVFGLMEPNVPFTKNILEYRQRCYEETGSSFLEKARRDLRDFNEAAPQPFTADISG